MRDQLHAKLARGVTFGPFRMPHLAEQVDDRFRQAFYTYLAEQAIPLLEGQIEKIKGRVFSHYDRPQFARLTEVRHRYFYKVSFSSKEGFEEAWGELDYDPRTASWIPSRAKPPDVTTLSNKRESDASLESRPYSDPPSQCPRCHSNKVATIQYGVPEDANGPGAAVGRRVRVRAYPVQPLPSAPTFSEEALWIICPYSMDDLWEWRQRRS